MSDSKQNSGIVVTGVIGLLWFVQQKKVTSNT